VAATWLENRGSNGSGQLRASGSGLATRWHNVPVVWYISGADDSTILSGKTLSGPQPGWRIVGPH